MQSTELHTSHVSLSVCLFMSNTLASFAKSAELIEMLFKGGGADTRGRVLVLDVDAHWRHLANTIKRSVLGRDVPLYQITLTTCCNLWSSYI